MPLVKLAPQKHQDGGMWRKYIFLKRGPNGEVIPVVNNTIVKYETTVVIPKGNLVKFLARLVDTSKLAPYKKYPIHGEIRTVDKLQRLLKSYLGRGQDASVVRMMLKSLYEVGVCANDEKKRIEIKFALPGQWLTTHNTSQGTVQIPKQSFTIAIHIEESAKKEQTRGFSSASFANKISSIILEWKKNKSKHMKNMSLGNFRPLGYKVSEKIEKPGKSESITVYEAYKQAKTGALAPAPSASFFKPSLPASHSDIDSQPHTPSGNKKSQKTFRK
jgi:hypothetical protein